MSGIKLTPYDRKVFEEELADFLPQNIIDVHTHIYKEDSRITADGRGLVTWPSRVAKHCTVENLLLTFEQMFPGKSVTPVLFGHPKANLSRTNDYTLECAKKFNLKAMYCTSWNTPAEEIYRVLTEDGFTGLKPYLSNSNPCIPDNEIRIFDFLPHEHLKIADSLAVPIILHIARPGRLKDPLNIAQLMEIEQRYPNIKLIVAHIGRAYIEADLGNAFDTLRQTERMLFDFSANTLDKAMIDCIEAVGPKRIMYGSDMPISKMRMYRIAEDGIYKNVVPRGLYGDVSDDKNMKETDETEITTFLYEELRAFKRCAEVLKLSNKDIADVFYNNAARVFGI